MPLPSHAQASTRSRTIAIVGAGFSGTALAVRLLRRPPASPCRIVLIERAGRFGCGLAYAGDHAGASLNVPAARMSIDERQPDDLLDYLQARGTPARPDEFISRSLYGEYLEARLRDAALAAPARVQLTRMSGTVTGVWRTLGPHWNVELSDGRSVLADSTVLALGHFPPRQPAALRQIAGTALYSDDPWRRHAGAPPSARVLLIGAGLTMADVACELARDPQGPREIVAVSRRGLLSHSRQEAATVAPEWDIGLDALDRATTLREIAARARQCVATASDAGIDWRHVMVALRERVPSLWQKLDAHERRRFIRHLQPYWDVHRHQLAPQVGHNLHQLIADGRLSIRAARIVSASQADGRAVVRLQPRGRSAIEVQTFDRIINCSGPDADPRRADSALVKSLLATGHMVPDPSGIGVRLDPLGRLVDREARIVTELYYLGPWLRARDLEATAVHELRLHATALADLLCQQRAAATVSDGGARTGRWQDGASIGRTTVFSPSGWRAPATSRAR